MKHIGSKNLAVVLACTLLVAILLPGIAGAQIDAGGIAGTVKDSSGAVVANANITLKNDLTDLQR